MKRRLLSFVNLALLALVIFSTAACGGSATPDLRAYRFYRFRTERLKVFDEAVFGAGVFVTATIHSGQRLIWERTDISSGADAN